MAFLNLTLVQFLAILIPLSGFLVALYFYDRSRRRVVVSTLRFWPRRPAPPVTRRHKKLQQPLSLLLQVIAVLLLLLAIADWRFGGGETERRHHVLMVDASAWMSARSGEATLLDDAKAKALAYLRALPAGDPVLLVRVDGAPAPVTPFTTDRETIRRAIREMEPGSTAADPAAAWELALNSLRIAADAGGASVEELLASRRSGEITYVGGNRAASAHALAMPAGALKRFRYIAVEPGEPDTGIVSFSAARDPIDRARWNVELTLASGAKSGSVRADFLFEGRAIGNRTARIDPGGEAVIPFSMRTDRAGTVEARLSIDDPFPGNDSARLRLPALRSHRVEVYGESPRSLLTLLAAPQLDLQFATGGEFDAASASAAVRVFRRFSPADNSLAGIYLEPSEERSPVPVARRAARVTATHWAADHPVTEGLRTSDLVLRRSLIFEPEPGDRVLLDSDQGPVLVARERDGRRLLVFGFDPTEPAIANRPSTPVLFLNALRWFAPDILQTARAETRVPGVTAVPVGEIAPEQVEVSATPGPPPAWFVSDGQARFYAERGEVTVRTPFQTTALSFSLPDAGREMFEAPEGALTGIPPTAGGGGLEARRLWPWLALLALAILAVDWRLFGLGSRQEQGGASRSALRPLSLRDEPEPVLEEVAR